MATRSRGNHTIKGTFWIGTERRLSKHHHYNLVYLHARRKHFPAFDDIAIALQEIWPIGDVASVEEIESRLAGKWPSSLVEAAIWKVAGDSAAAGHLLVDLELHTLDRKLPLALLPPETPPWFLIHFPTCSCLNQKSYPRPPICQRAYRFQAQRLMRLPLMRSGVTSFTATWLPCRRCWLVPLKPAWQRSQGLHAQRFRDWFGEQSNWGGRHDPGRTGAMFHSGGGRRLPASLGRTTTTTACRALGAGGSAKRGATVPGIS
ncbi:MAG TPA: hypothetical protein VL485_02845 [Ktedonobacteraceae bacterium]|nr:hypothetical protein [Ktedonobacteraceae bacterium]